MPMSKKVLKLKREKCLAEASLREMTELFRELAVNAGDLVVSLQKEGLSKLDSMTARKISRLQSMATRAKNLLKEKESL
jgi:hypothetical protein